MNNFVIITSFVFQLVWTQWGNHSSKMFSQEAVDRITQHDTKDPMFLYLCYQAVHSSNRKEDALQAPQYWINKVSSYNEYWQEKVCCYGCIHGLWYWESKYLTISS